MKTAKSQELRLLLINRWTLAAAQLTLENAVRGTLKAFGLKVGAVTPARFESRVLELLAVQPRLRATARPMLEARDGLRRQLAALHRMVLQVTRNHEACRWLMTGSGVGPVVPQG